MGRFVMACSPTLSPGCLLLSQRRRRFVTTISAVTVDTLRRKSVMTVSPMGTTRLADLRRETAYPCGHAVGRRRQREKLVLAAGIGHHRTLQPSLAGRPQLHSRWNDSTGRIRDRAANNPGGAHTLRVGQGDPQQPGCEQKASLPLRSSFAPQLPSTGENGAEPATWC